MRQRHPKKHTKKDTIKYTGYNNVPAPELNEELIDKIKEIIASKGMAFIPYHMVKPFPREEFFQDCYDACVIKYMEKMQGNTYGDFGGYLYRMVIRTCLDRGIYLNRKKRKATIIQLGHKYEGRPAPEPYVETGVLTDTLIDTEKLVVKMGLESKKHFKCAKYILKDLAGFTSEEIAEEFGVSNETIEAEVERNKPYLRKAR